jgi:predicted XRE-type DNA-binding protein
MATHTAKCALGVLGSDNIFADLGLPDAEELLLKSMLASRIRAIASDRRLSASRVRKIAGLSNEEVSDLLEGTPFRFSAERMIRILNLLGVSVSIALREEPKGESGTTFVHF